MTLSWYDHTAHGRLKRSVHCKVKCTLIITMKHECTNNFSCIIAAVKNSTINQEKVGMSQQQ